MVFDADGKHALAQVSWLPTVIKAAKRLNSANGLVFGSRVLVSSFTTFLSSEPKIHTQHTGFL